MLLHSSFTSITKNNVIGIDAIKPYQGGLVINSVTASDNNFAGIVVVGTDNVLQGPIDANDNGSRGIAGVPNDAGFFDMTLSGDIEANGNGRYGIDITSFSDKPGPDPIGNVYIDGDVTTNSNGRSGFRSFVFTNVNVTLRNGGSLTACGNNQTFSDIDNAGAGKITPSSSARFTCDSSKPAGLCESSCPATISFVAGMVKESVDAAKMGNNIAGSDYEVRIPDLN